MTQWRLFKDEMPPTDKPILAWCVDEKCDCNAAGDGKLCLYHGHAEGLSRVDDGPHVLEFGGGWDDRSWENESAGWCPDWWFLRGSEFEIAANPVWWQPIEDPAP